MELPPNEQRVADCIVKLMRTEDGRSNEDSYVDGLHYIMNQPEFNTGNRMVGLMGLVEQRKLIEAMMDNQLNEYGVQVIIGKENRAKSIQSFSVVSGAMASPMSNRNIRWSAYRMHYARTISQSLHVVDDEQVISTFTAGTQNDRKKMQNN
jgi:heat-inducible transcriptional repressor